MDSVDFAAQIMEFYDVPGGRFEMVQWHWPDMVSFDRTEQQLMLEMSLPPMAADASACFPEIDQERRCFMGTLFVRHPGIAVSGRSEGRKIQVIRCIFDQDRSGAIVGNGPPTIGFLQSLLDIRNDALRSLMRLAHRELVNPIDRSPTAMEALFTLVEVELSRVFRHAASAETASRLAPWQFRRVRERIEAKAPTPKVSELAELCGISPRHLHRQFIALTGKTVSAYIDAYRVEQSKLLLARAEVPLKQVAEQAGFAHGNSFARAFRRATGLSPREFRQRASAIGARENLA